MKLHASIVLSIGAVALLSCRDREVIRTEGPLAVTAARLVDPEPENLLDHARGVVVTSRTGEDSFESSALHSIDGDPQSLWSSPPGDPQQSLTVALPTLTEVTAVGFSSEKAVRKARAPKNIQFDGSLDGSAFFPLVTAVTDKAADTQLFRTQPVRLRSLRVSLREGLGPSDTVDVGSLLLRGNEVEPLRERRIAGRWKLNEDLAQFEQSGARMTGRVEWKEPMEIEGGTNGRIYRFVWLRGFQYGLGAAAVTDDSRSLSGIWWFEESNPFHLGAPWFGEKQSGEAPPRSMPGLLKRYLETTGRFPLYGIRIADDDLVDRSASSETIAEVARFLKQTDGRRFRFIAGEYRAPSIAENMKRSERQLASFRDVMNKAGVDISRIEFVAAGNDPGGKPPVLTKVQRAVYSTVELVDLDWKPRDMIEDARAKRNAATPASH
ncbi:MAG TPA: discoidin domain-containing protein [Thermoanaerobaculia bacterium]|nr:discoidin domain-containing protein [Thermoanaerobaculia bacterium]